MLPNNNSNCQKSLGKCLEISTCNCARELIMLSISKKYVMLYLLRESARNNPSKARENVRKTQIKETQRF